jgi:hypothetical protein
MMICLWSICFMVAFPLTAYADVRTPVVAGRAPTHLTVDGVAFTVTPQR